MSQHFGKYHVGQRVAQKCNVSLSRLAGRTHTAVPERKMRALKAYSNCYGSPSFKNIIISPFFPIILYFLLYKSNGYTVSVLTCSSSPRAPSGWRIEFRFHDWCTRGGDVAPELPHENFILRLVLLNIGPYKIIYGTQ